MKIHYVGIHIYVLISLCHVGHARVHNEFKVFLHEASLDNKRCTAQLQSFSTKAQSNTQCSRMCVLGANCTNFFYSESTNDCTGCVPLMSQPCEACTEEANGTRYYKPKEGEDCLTIKQKNPWSPSGIYTVELSTYRHLEVYCDMDTDGGGWTVFQNRYDGTVDFYRTFQEYTDGFGNVTGEFWLGVQNIHEMAPPEIQSEIYLYVDDGSESNVDRTSVFSVGNRTCYQVTLKNGHAALTYNDGMCFSAKDYGQRTVCAVYKHSGWWYWNGISNCARINPNGLYTTPPGTASMRYQWFVHHLWKDVALATSKIMFRRN